MDALATFLFRIDFFTYWSWGKIPGSAEAGVIGVIGPGVDGPIDGGAIWLLFCTNGDIIFCYK